MRSVEAFVQVIACGLSLSSARCSNSASDHPKGTRNEDSSASDSYILSGDPLDLLPSAGSISASRVIIEIGVNDEATFFHLLNDDESLVVIGAEPDPTIGRRHPRHPRFYMLPVAIADVSYHRGALPPQGVFHKMGMSGCSSLKRPRRSANVYLCGEERKFNCTCGTMVGRFDVPLLPLAPILERAASFGPVFLLEVDAQGADVEVVRSAGSALKHVQRLVMECQEPRVSAASQLGLLYHDQLPKEEVVSRMYGLGFYLERCWPTGSMHTPNAIGEENCVFARSNVLIEGLRDDCFMHEDLENVNREYSRMIGGSAVVTDFMNASMATLGHLCCNTGYEFMLGCWDAKEFTREKCCLKDYFEALGLPSLSVKLF